MRKAKIISMAILFILTGTVLGLVISANFNIYTDGYTENSAGPSGVESASREVSKSAIEQLGRVSDAMVEVASAIKPSVVNISTTRIVKTRGGHGMDPFFNDPMFRRFFGDEFDGGNSAPKRESRQSLGSGVIVRPDGYILTNNHVIKDADEIHVLLSDNRTFTGKVIGKDPKTDLAVVKIDATGLIAAKWGDSDKLRVGDMVIAVGNPYGLNLTVTTGIVSAKGRANVNIADYEDFIQTDAAINPGNSGGPLVNIRGELVGINTAIFSTTGGYQGIGFSIPSSMARLVMESLIKDGRVIRGWLGVTIQPITKEIAQQLKIKDENGVLIADVVEGGPAETGGLRPEDVIVEFKGKRVEDPGTLRNMVGATPPGTEVSVKVSRDGKPMTLTLKIGQLPEEQKALTGDYENVLRGVHVQDLTKEIRNVLGASSRIKGVVVTETEEDIGLSRGDIIMEVNKKPVDNIQSYDKAVSGIKADDNVILRIYRDGRVFFLPLSGR